MALCGALTFTNLTRSMVRCRKHAGMGTDHPGIGRCRYHERPPKPKPDDRFDHRRIADGGRRVREQARA